MLFFQYLYSSALDAFTFFVGNAELSDPLPDGHSIGTRLVKLCDDFDAQLMSSRNNQYQSDSVFERILGFFNPV